MRSKVTNRFAPYQFKSTVIFSTVTTERNEFTGMATEVKTEVFRKRFAKIKNTLTQKYSVVGTEYERAFNIAIRHDKRLQEYEYLVATINGTDYRIIDSSYDDETYNSYDIITLTKKEGNNDG